MWRQVSLSPAEGERWKAHGLPLEEGVIEGKVFCVWNGEGEDVPFPLGHEYPMNQEGEIMRVPQSVFSQQMWLVAEIIKQPPFFPAMCICGDVSPLGLSPLGSLSHREDRRQVPSRQCNREVKISGVML